MVFQKLMWRMEEQGGRGLIEAYEKEAILSHKVFELGMETELLDTGRHTSDSLQKIEL